MRLYNLLHSGLVKLDYDKVPAVLLDRLVMIDAAVSDELLAETQEIRNG